MDVGIGYLYKYSKCKLNIWYSLCIVLRKIQLALCIYMDMFIGY